jgi:macrolide-specific efflux system membrane fusion protein
MVAEAQASQLDVGQLKKGQTARLTLDADDDTAFDARVTDVAEDAESSEASAGSSSVVQFAVELTPVKLPAAARAGMTGTAEVTVRSRTGVVIVPSAAVQGSDDAPTVQVMENGTPVTRPVVAGLATANQTEIVTGVQAGETVVTGTISDAEPAEGDETGGFPGGPGGAPVIREAPGGFGGPPGGGGARP